MRPTENKFCDGDGRTWVLRVDYAAMKRVRSILGIDLPKVATDPAQLGELLGNPLDLIDVIWCVVEPRARELQVTDEQFGGSLAGDVILKARDALLAGLLDFFPQPQRGLLALSLEKAYALDRKLAGTLSRALESGELGAAIDKALVLSGSTATDSQEPSE